MIPKSYREQKSCLGCKYLYLWKEIEEHDEYYCHIDGSERPKDGTGFEEWTDVPYGSPLHSKQFHDGRIKWDAWAKAHEVRSYGLCDEWEEA